MAEAKQNQELAKEVARRRTFAIISHPDAGKTTLTEKLLMYGGAIQEAGTVTQAFSLAGGITYTPLPPLITNEFHVRYFGCQTAEQATTQDVVHE
jgi:hypothetical protein